MQAAQRLFQDGHISYHRTDSTTLSDEALAESASAIREMFGDDYYAGPRRYATKVKNAQEAHEAIRPTKFTSAAAALEGVLSGDDLRLYELIWKRTMASQMVDARVLRTTIEISADAGQRSAGGLHRLGQGDRVRRLPPRLRRRQRRSVGRARRAGDRPADAHRRRAGRSRQGARAAGGPRAGRTRDEPAGALHGSVAHQGARADRRRPAVDVRGDDRHDRAPRLRVPPGQGARAELHRVRRHAAAARAFRRPHRRRVHGGDGGRPRPDLARRARVARLHPAVLSRRQASPRARRSGEAGAGDRGVSADRRRRRSGVGRDDPRAHRPLRSVPAARRRRSRQDRGPAADARRRPI